MLERVGRLQEQKTEDTIFTAIRIKSSQENGKGKKVTMATDTGVRKTILNRSDWLRIKDTAKMVKTRIKFRPYGTDIQLPIKGRAKVWLTAKAGAQIQTWVYINDDDTETSLLGKRDAIRLGIVTITPDGKSQEVGSEDEQPVKTMRTTVKTTDHGIDKKIQKLIHDYEDIFQGIGKNKGDPVKIQVREGIQPVIQPPRRIPIHYLKPLQDHLEELIQGDVIEGPLQEEEEGTWISNLVITDKKWEGKPEENRVQYGHT